MIKLFKVYLIVNTKHLYSAFHYVVHYNVPHSHSKHLVNCSYWYSAAIGT